MPQTDELFELIRSLSKSEKRHFSLMAALIGGKDNNYIKLFEYMSKQEQYNEAAILKKFKNEKFIDHFSAYKHKLYNNILRALNDLYASATPDLEVQNILRNVEVLHNKALFRPAYKQLQKAKQLAKKIENFPLQVLIIQWEMHLSYQLQLPDMYKLLPELIEESDEVIRNFQKYNKYNSDYYKLQLKRMTQMRLRHENDIKEIKEQFSSYYDNAPDTSSTRGKLRYLEVLAFLYYPLNDKKKVRKILFEIDEIYENNPHLIHTSSGAYLKNLKRLINFSLLNHDYKTLDIGLSKLEKYESKFEVDSLAAKQFLIYIKFLYAYNTYKWEETEQYAQEMKEFMSKYSYFLNKASQLIYSQNLASYYFITQNYDESLEWVNRILNLSEEVVQVDSHAFIRILRLIIHYELNDIVLLDDFHRQAKRFIKNKSHLYDFEKMLLAFIQKIKKVNQKQDQKELCRTFHEELTAFKEQNSGLPLTGMDEVVLWLRSKVEDKPITDLVQAQERN